MKHSLLLLVLIGMGIVLPAVAQTATDHNAHHVAQAENADVAPLAEGEVRKVDKDAGTITLKHGPIANLKMPPVSMVFRARDPAMLDQVKAGDKVKVAAEKIGSAFTVMRIERVE